MNRRTTSSLDAGSGAVALRTLGEYHLLRKLGQGGMGEIFLAKRLGMGGFEKTVVIKCMLESLASSEEFVAMFFDEAHLAARLNHPNIAPIHDFGVIDGQYYLTMEYIPGEDLGSIISRLHRLDTHIPIAVAVRIVIDVCEALSYAHALSENGRPLGIVHRDVSPSNVMVGYQGVVKLLDFGIAKATERVSHTRAGGVKGKLSFLAPEVIRGLDIDARADLFSLGITLQSLLTREHPFRRDSEIAMAHAITEKDPTDPRTLRAEIPAELVAILGKALARDRDLRFGSAAELGAALQSFLSRHAATTGPREVAGFLHELFGPEAAAAKIDVPTLSRLDLAAVVNTPTAMSRVPTSAAEPATRALVPGTPPPTPINGTRAPARRGQAAWLFAAVAVGTLVTGVAFWIGARRAGVAPVPAATAVPAPVTGTTAAPPVRGNLAATPAPALRVAPLTPEPPPRAAPRAARAPRSMRHLDEAALKAVVGRAHPRLVACFKRHAAELPAESGEIKIELAVAGTGAVTGAETTLGKGARALSACLTGEARRLRFPAHVDREVRFAFPLRYRRGGS